VHVLAIAAAVLAAAPAAAAGAKTYNGTARGLTVSLTPHERSLNFKLTYEAPCDMAGVQDNREWAPGDPPGVGPLRLDKHGRFSEQRRGFDTGMSKVDLDFAGRIGRHAARGTFDITVHPEQVSTTCTTGLVHWTARSS
jgi:hypothetical protein